VKLWHRHALRALLLYSLDMCVAVAGWTIGFGLELENPWALVLLLLVARWVFHVLQLAFMRKDVALEHCPDMLTIEERRRLRLVLAVVTDDELEEVRRATSEEH
jgi:hypothetical protein